MTKRTLLIDADVLAYETAAANEVATHWGEGYWTWYCDENVVRQKIEERLEQYLEELDADDYVLALTDSERNYRFDILPTYKGNRAGVKKPLVLKAIKQWMIDEKDAYFRPRLEGDDILGILATGKKIKGEKVVVSIDKDLKTIPGLYCRDPQLGIIEITPEEADYWHMFQTLTGDTTDGYDGCPGVGAVKAEKALREVLKLVPYHHEVQRGKRKGEIETRFEYTPADNLWEVVVSHYVAAGLTEADALVQAQVARILHSSDYDFKKKEPIYWTPKT